MGQTNTARGPRGVSGRTVLRVRPIGGGGDGGKEKLVYTNRKKKTRILGSKPGGVKHRQKSRVKRSVGGKQRKKRTGGQNHQDLVSAHTTEVKTRAKTKVGERKGGGGENVQSLRRVRPNSI